METIKTHKSKMHLRSDEYSSSFGQNTVEVLDIVVKTFQLEFGENITSEGLATAPSKTRNVVEMHYST